MDSMFTKSISWKEKQTCSILSWKEKQIYSMLHIPSLNFPASREHPDDPLAARPASCQGAPLRAASRLIGDWHFQSIRHVTAEFLC